MRNKKFFDIDHARLYLIGSIIRVDGKPVYVQDVKYNRAAQNRWLHYTPVEKMTDVSKVFLSSKRVDMNPVPLGFINFTEWGKPKTAIQAYRIPARQWRIGLTSSNLKLNPFRFDSYDVKSKVMQSVYFKRSICNEFPSLEKVIKMIKDKKAESQAFSRDFCIRGKTGQLNFIQLKDPVGKLFKEEPMLFDEYIYLSQLLEKALWQK